MMSKHINKDASLQQAVWRNGGVTPQKVQCELERYEPA